MTAPHPRAGERVERRFHLRRAQPALLEQPVAADNEMRVRGAPPRLAREAPETLRPATGRSRRRRVSDDGAANRMLGPHLKRCGEPQHLRAAQRRPTGSTSTTWRRPWVSVPVLSNATQRIAASLSRCTPPLINTPFRASGRKRGHDRHGRGNHQGTRTRDDQQNQRSINPAWTSSAPARSGGPAR